jgi:zinc/manganese transport system substrate-binding protein
MKRWLLGTLLALAGGLANAQLNVVATTSNMGLLSRTVGGDQVRVTVLVPPDRDAHYLEARPTMMAALRRADLLVAVGAELEVGWLPAALRGANNPVVLPGRIGYFEGAAQIELIETDVQADRAAGDVHPEGNPHFYTDPVRLAEVGVALARRLGEIDPANAERYVANAERFSAAVVQRLPAWLTRARDAPGVVAYHRDVNYLFERLGVTMLGYVEPLPGIPPTASHLADLIRQLDGQRGLIAHLPFQPARGPEFLARELGWRVVRLPSNVGLDARADDYFALIDQWVDAIASSR